MKRIYFIISLLFFAIMAIGQNVRPSLIYSDNPNIVEVNADGELFTYRYRIYQANPDSIQYELNTYLQEKKCNWLTIEKIIPDAADASAGNIVFKAVSNRTGTVRKCIMMSALPIRIYLITQPGSVAPPNVFGLSAPRFIIPKHTGVLTLAGSEQGVVYYLYRDGNLIESRQGTGAPLDFQITLPGLYTMEGTGINGVTSKMGEVLVEWQNVNLYNKDRNYVLEKVYISATSLSDSTLCVRNITYTDGFGRNMQETQIGASPSGTGDLVFPYEYGMMGRIERTYLPYEKEGNWGAYVRDACAISNWDIYGTFDAAYAFTKTEYDNSPLDRVVKQTGVGKAWHTSDKGVTTDYLLNAENEVRLYKVELFTGALSLDGYYHAGELEKTVTTDEDGHSVETFTDNMDKIVLTVTLDGDKRLETYYVYDDRDQFRWVLSPEASFRLGTTVNTDVLYQLAYYYDYDRLGRMTVKRLPGCEPIYMVYDKRDRMVLSQDGNQRAADSKKWSYSVYDDNSRIVENGELVLTTAYTFRQLSDAAWNVENYQPAGVKTPFQFTVYGSYEATEHVTPHPFTAVSDYASEYHPLVTGLVTSTKTRILGTDTWLTATTYYDEKCRPIQTVSDNQHGMLSTVNTAYDFVGNVLKQRETHGVTANIMDVLETVNTYDERNRLLAATCTLNGGTPGVGTSATVSYEYDEIGRLVTKHYGNTTTETLDYNIRGWLTSKESAPFKMRLCYNNSQAGTSACYNGNISEWQWQQGMDAAQMYGFRYDHVSRLKETAHYQKSGTSWDLSSNDYVEKNITYDRNGNILTMRRTANGVMVDNLLYNYTGNRLVSLIESVRGAFPQDVYLPGGVPNGTYEYDSNGNMIKDTRKGLEFSYNCLDLLSEVKRNGECVSSYLYSADGTKLGVRNVDGGSGYDYVGSLIYKKEDGISVLEAAYFADGELKTNAVHYTLTDHLGSIRAIVDSSGIIQEQNDYYPFGSKHVNTSYASNGNRYTFNGKERQDLLDLNMYDFGARMYASDIARWSTVDPLAEDYYSQSIFGYCLGCPIRFIDPTGTFATDFYDQYGELIVSTNDGSNEIVVVPEERLNEFKGNVYWASSGILNDPGWNAWWADEFKGTQSYLSSLSSEQLSLLDRIDTAWGRKNAVNYWLNPTMGNYFVAQASIALGQYTNPELLLGGATIFAGPVPTGYKSFAEFKNVYGSAGSGKAWHHIVEQNPANVAKFGSRSLHNADNIVRIPHGKGSVHAKISGHYSSKPDKLGGLRVREWLHLQSYRDQYNYGIQTYIKNR